MSLDQEAMFLIGSLIAITLIFCIIVACLSKWCKSSSQVREKDRRESTKENIEQSQHQNPYVVCDFSKNQ